jgi:archaellum component FlaF (FlaF/FlaG flagellin family)
MIDIDVDNNEKYYGMYKGRVENNGLDIPDPNPKELQPDTQGRGRCQIRVLGVHSPNNNASFIDGIPTVNLPWAEQCASLFAGAFVNTNIGVSMVPPVGSWVWVFFDNGDHNKPNYFASIPAANDFDPLASGYITVINTRSGHKITIDDTFAEETGQHAGKITIKSSANNQIVLDDSNDAEKITLKDTHGNNILLDSTTDAEKIQITQLGVQTGQDNKVTMDVNGMIIKSGKNNQIVLDDTDNAEKITIKDKYGNSVLLDSTNGAEQIKITQLGSQTGQDNKVTMDANGMIIKSGKNHQIILDDTNNAEKISVISKHEQSLVIDDTNNAQKIKITDKDGKTITMDSTSGNKQIKLLDHEGQVVLIDSTAKGIHVEDANGNIIDMGSNGIEWTDSSGNKIKTSGTMIDINGNFTVSQ